MNWFNKFLRSSIGNKLLMSLTGLFLIIFLVVHLAGNLQLLADDGGEKFNMYTKFMTTNPLIKTVSYLLYTFILLHAIEGMMLWRKNRAARGPVGYAVRTGANSGFASRNMGWLGVIIFVFLVLHMWQFWFQMKIGGVGLVTYGNEAVKDLYSPVSAAFSNWYFVVIYVISMIVIGLHLWHGFESSFQTLGLNHKKYTPVIRFVGKAYSVLIPAAFALIPVYFFIMKNA